MRKHGSAYNYGARYQRRSVVETVSDAEAMAWLLDARRRGASDGAAGIWRPGCWGPTLMAAYTEAHIAARERTKQAV